ncbi:MAG: transcriptional repressor LexA [Fimbriimonadales bacterium]|nr:transcriptional repressor LexA [Fimbriimonadales bacterium]
MTRGLTKRQEEVLRFICDYVEERGFPPSIREIGSKFRIGSLRGVTVHLDALQRKGFITRGSNPRSIQLTHPSYQPSQKSKMIPIVGTIAAGVPITAEENVEDVIPVPNEMVRNIEGAFLLRVKGDSMTGEGIMPRDLVLIKPQKVARNSDLVAVMVDDEATVKRIQFEKDHVKLHPSNPAYEPIVVNGEDARIIGKVVGLLRDYEGMAF